MPALLAAGAAGAQVLLPPIPVEAQATIRSGQADRSIKGGSQGLPTEAVKAEAKWGGQGGFCRRAGREGGRGGGASRKPK